MRTATQRVCAWLMLTAASACGGQSDPLSEAKQRAQGSSGAESSSPSYVPMHVVSESFFKRWPNGPQGCFYWDDTLDWSAAGSLAPGESFTFTPSIPTCQGAEWPVIMAWASWDASTIEISSVAPDNDGTSDDLSQIGTPIVGTQLGNRSTLCMFTDAGLAFNYAITIRNVGTRTAYDVKLYGQQRNGWPTFFYDKCAKADADRDGWNDSFEHTLGILTYYGYPSDGTYPYDTFMASNYLAATGTATPNDEVDVHPADFNDDGLVDQTDVDRVTAHIGEGSGYSLDTIGPNPGTPNYQYAQAQPWRRYDVDGDGLVSQADRAIVASFVGQSIPSSEDWVNPTVRITAPTDGSSVSRGGYTTIWACAGDNGILDRVEFYIDGKLASAPTEGSVSNADNDRPHFGHRWYVPKKPGTHTIEVRAWDAGGRSASQTIEVNAK